MHRVDVDAMLEELPVRRYQEWKAFYELDPWGDQRADLRMAVLAMVIANAWRSKGTKPFKPEDFMPFPESGPPEPQSVESMAGAAKAFAAMFGTIIKAE